MKTKQMHKVESRLRDMWNAHTFSRRDRKDKMQQSRLRMLMGAADTLSETTVDTSGNWW